MLELLLNKINLDCMSISSTHNPFLCEKYGFFSYSQLLLRTHFPSAYPTLFCSCKTAIQGEKMPFGLLLGGE